VMCANTTFLEVFALGQPVTNLVAKYRAGSRGHCNELGKLL
jgi:hypothetical protein